MFARVRIESLKFVRIDGAQHSRREHALKWAADPARAVPGGRDLHDRRAALRGDRERGDRARAGVGLGEDPCRLDEQQLAALDAVLMPGRWPPGWED